MLDDVLIIAFAFLLARQSLLFRRDQSHVLCLRDVAKVLVLFAVVDHSLAHVSVGAMHLLLLLLHLVHLQTGDAFYLGLRELGEVVLGQVLELLWRQADLGKDLLGEVVIVVVHHLVFAFIFFTFVFHLVCSHLLVLCRDLATAILPGVASFLDVAWPLQLPFSVLFLATVRVTRVRCPVHVSRQRHRLLHTGIRFLRHTLLALWLTHVLPLPIISSSRTTIMVRHLIQFFLIFDFVWPASLLLRMGRLLHQIFALLLLLLVVVLFTLDVWLVCVHLVLRHLVLVRGVCWTLMPEVLRCSRRLSIIITVWLVHAGCLSLWRALGLTSCGVPIGFTLLALGNWGTSAVDG